MSRATARAGLQAFLAPLPSVGTIYDTFPTNIPGTAFTAGMPAGVGGGAVIVVFIRSENETRKATGGAFSGWKRIDYTVELHIFHRWMTGDAQAAMAAFDALIEDTKVLLRSDRTARGTFWEEGEKAVTATYGDPQLQRGAVETWGQLSFNATEFIQS